jgi:hypothetical protein
MLWLAHLAEAMQRSRRGVRLDRAGHTKEDVNPSELDEFGRVIQGRAVDPRSAGDPV